MSIEMVMPSNYLILCHPLLLLPSINQPPPTWGYLDYCRVTFLDVRLPLDYKLLCNDVYIFTPCA